MSSVQQPTFADLYEQRAAPQLEALFGRPLTESERARLKGVVAERLVDKPAAIINPHRNLRVPTTLSKAAAWFMQRKPMAPIVTGHGTLFRQHGEYNSVIGEMITMLMDSRKIVKNKMFDLMREGRPTDDPEVKALDQGQKIWKLLANSFYGAYGEKGFHFYDPAMGPAVTYTGQLIIASTLYGFESFLGGNFWLRNADEMARHIAECLRLAGSSEIDVEEEWGEHPDQNMFTHEWVVDRLVDGSAPGWDARRIAQALVEGMDEKQLKALALRGNVYAFMDFPVAGDLLFTSLNGEIREADPGKIAKHHPDGKVALEQLSEGLLKWVALPWMPADMPRLVGAMTRRVVTLTDTDSTFLNLGPWMEYVARHYDVEAMSEDERLTALNVIIYLLRLFNDHQMWELTKNLGVPEDRRRLINFKSEFVIGRMVLTNGKKHYAALNRFQEGARIVGDKVDLKGLAMKKTTTAKSTGTYLEKSLETKVLRPKEVDRVGLIHDVLALEETVRTSLENGGTEYATPGTLGRLAEYATPYSMPVVRGMTAWNAVFPDAPIREGDRVNMFRIRVSGDVTRLVEEQAKWPEGSEEFTAISTIIETFFGADAPEELSKNGFNWFAFPKDVRELPKWVRSLIDVDSVVNANTGPILPIMESVGVRTLQLTDAETFSTLISF